MGEEVRASADVPLTCEEAFTLHERSRQLVAARVSWSQDALEEIGMETLAGGFL